MQRRPLIWIGSTKNDLSAFPEAVKDVLGYALHIAQLGDTHPDTRRMRAPLSEVCEVRVELDNVQYRTMYFAKFEEAIYALHAFEKKSKKGISTPQKELRLVAIRLREAKEYHAIHYPKKRKN